MLSVLIPVQNWKLAGLVYSLHGQLSEAGIPFEILIGEDGSLQEYTTENQKLTGLPHIHHYYHPKALGRSGNRNFLASLSQYPYLLFIDGDSGIEDSLFITKYMNSARPDHVICGGTLYYEDPPPEPDKVLRWKYGRAREQKVSSLRNRHPWNSFSSFNFLIPRTVFEQIRFDDSISRYGHEDTLFGYHLKIFGIHVSHIDNGLLHLGIEPAAQFLAKTRDSVHNLHELYLTGKLPQDRIRSNSLLKSWLVLKKLGLLSLVRIWFKGNQSRIETVLSGSRPSLFLFDLYKLGLISQIG